MIKLSNGYKLEFLASGGALGYDGRGWLWEWPLKWVRALKLEEFTIVTKTLTLEPRKGNLRWHKPWDVLRPLANGNWVNAIGLTNPGIDWWIQKYGNLKVIVSIFPETPQEVKVMCAKLNNLEIIGIEINASCPNVQKIKNVIEICKTAKSITRHPVILKISYLHQMQIIKKASCYLDAIHAINTVPCHIVFPNKKSPLAKYGGGGVSGPIIAPFARAKVKELAEKINLPIIAGGGICSLRDIQIFKKLGASTFSIGSLFLSKPWMPNKIIKTLQ